jgi:O-acetylhomoserine (thiol)-lyase
MYCKHYEQMNIWLSEAADLLSRFLRRQGFKAMWFPETDDPNYFYGQRGRGGKAYIPSFSHISAASAAGLGVRGKVGVVLTPQFGPRQRWISVITTASLVPTPKFEGELCLERTEPGTCGDKCIKVCQAKQSGALKPWPEEGGVDMFRCNFGYLKARGLACGMCIKVCPVGRSQAEA